MLRALVTKGRTRWCWLGKFSCPPPSASMLSAGFGQCLPLQLPCSRKGSQECLGLSFPPGTAEMAFFSCFSKFLMLVKQNEIPTGMFPVRKRRSRNIPCCVCLPCFSGQDFSCQQHALKGDAIIKGWVLGPVPKSLRDSQSNLAGGNKWWTLP